MSEHRVDWSRPVAAHHERHIHRKNLRALYLLAATGLISVIFQLLLFWLRAL